MEVFTVVNLLSFTLHKIVKQVINRLLGKLLKLRNRHLFICDMIVFSITPFLALLLRLDGNLEVQGYILELGIATILFLAVKLIVLWSYGFYKRYWRYASIEELIYIAMLIVGAVAIQTMLFEVVNNILYPVMDKLPRSLPFIDGLLILYFHWGTAF